MSSVEVDLIEILREFGFGAVAIYMMYRLEDKITKLTEKISEFIERGG